MGFFVFPVALVHGRFKLYFSLEIVITVSLR